MTSSGHRLLEHVEKLESTLAAVETNVTGDNIALTGEVRLGATEGFGSFFLTPQIARFCEGHPGISVDILPPPRTLNLSKREADASVAIDRPSANSFVTCMLSKYRLQPYATPEYLDTNRPITGVQDLVGHKWIDYVDDLIYSPQQFSLTKWLPSIKPSLRSTSVIAQARRLVPGWVLQCCPVF